MAGRQERGEIVSQAHVVGLGRRVPDGRFQAGLGVVVAAHRMRQDRDFGRVDNGTADNTRDQEVLEDVQRRSDRLRTITRLNFDGSLAPAFDALRRRDADQHGGLERLDAKGSPQRLDVGNANRINVYTIDR